MILGFKNRDTEDVFHRKRVKIFSVQLQRTAYRKLLMIHAAVQLSDLKVPPGNQLKKLKGKHLYSIRINKQWRVCFQWQQGSAHNVHIIDYH